MLVDYFSICRDVANSRSAESFVAYHIPFAFVECSNGAIQLLDRQRHLGRETGNASVDVAELLQKRQVRMSEAEVAAFWPR